MAYECLYSESKEKRIEGCDLVQLWSCRGRIPVAIEATATFTRILEDSESPEETQRNSLSMAVVRFVNGIMDQQQKQIQAQSISKLAQKVNFPRFLVDIRHETTHSNLPSLEMLKMAALKSLEWLKTAYWDAQKNYLPSLKKTISHSLQIYKAERIIVLQSTANQPKRKKMADSVINEDKMAQKCLSEIENFMVSGLIRNVFYEEFFSFISSSDSFDFWLPFIETFGRMTDKLFSVEMFQCLIELCCCEDDQNIQYLNLFFWLFSKFSLSTSDVEHLVSATFRFPSGASAKIRELLQPDRIKVKIETSLVDIDDDLERMKNKLASLKEAKKLNLSTPAWKVSDNWKPCPLGLIPHQTSKELMINLFTLYKE